MLQISHRFFHKTCLELGIFLGEERDTELVCFSSLQDVLKRNQAKKMFESIVRKEGMNFLGWRQVPTVPGVLGHKALEKMPCIEQAFVERPKDVEKRTSV